MPATVPMSDLSRHTTDVTARLDEGDIILARRDAEDLYLSTRARHDREAHTLRVTTETLSMIAATRPDIAGEALTGALPWMVWLPNEEKVHCLTELLANLRAGAETGELRPFFLAIAAWESTAVTWSDPDLARSLLEPTADVPERVVPIGRPNR